MRISSERRAFIRARALERFRHYVTIDTRSDPASRRYPSSEGQWHLARIMRDELNAMEEWIPVPALHKSTEVILHMCRL